VGAAVAAALVATALKPGSASGPHRLSSLPPPLMWRSQFFSAIPFTLSSLYLLVKLPEPRPSIRFREDGHTAPFAIIKVLGYPLTLICCVLLLYAEGVVRVLFVPWGATYALNPLNVPYELLLHSITIGAVVMVGSVVMFGWLGDVLGRRKVMVAAQISTGLLVFPLLSLLRRTQYPTCMWSLTLFHVLFFGVLSGALQGCYPALLADIFPAPIRCTGVAVANSLSRIPSSACFLIIIDYLDKRYTYHTETDPTNPASTFQGHTLQNIGYYVMVTSFMSAVFTLLVPVRVPRA